MKPAWILLAALPAFLAGCGEDEVPVKKPVPAPAPKAQALSEEEVDQLADEALLDEDLAEPGLSDDEIDALVDDLLEEETR